MVVSSPLDAILPSALIRLPSHAIDSPLKLSFTVRREGGGSMSGSLPVAARILSAWRGIPFEPARIVGRDFAAFCEARNLGHIEPLCRYRCEAHDRALPRIRFAWNFGRDIGRGLRRECEILPQTFMGDGRALQESHGLK